MALTISSCSRQPETQPAATEAPRKTYTLMLSTRGTRLANISVDPVRETELQHVRTLSGMLSGDPQRRTVLTSRIPGRVDALFSAQPGMVVRKGDRIAEIHSPELAASVAEFVRLTRSSGSAETVQMAQAARQRLLRAGFIQKQIEDWEKGAAPSTTFPIHASEQGVVKRIAAPVGTWIAADEILMELAGADPDVVVVRLDAGTEHLVRPGMRVTVSGHRWTSDGRVDQVDARYQEDRSYRTALVRMDAPPEGSLPGEPVRVQIRSSTGKTTVIPSDAVLHGDNRSAVFIDAGDGSYRMTAVETGSTQDGQTEIRDGLKAGQKVVVTGAYLLYSELVLRNNGELRFPALRDDTDETADNH